MMPRMDGFRQEVTGESIATTTGNAHDEASTHPVRLCEKCQSHPGLGHPPEEGNAFIDSVVQAVALRQERHVKLVWLLNSRAHGPADLTEVGRKPFGARL